MSIAMRVYTVPHKVTVHQVGPIREQLLELLSDLKKNDSITIYVSDIREIDAAGFQLLISLVKESLERSVQLQFAGSITPELEIALLTGGFGREIPADGQHMQQIFQTMIGGGNAQ